MFKRKYKSFMYLGVVLGLLIFLQVIRLLPPVEAGLMKVFKPVLSLVYRSSVEVRKLYGQQTERRDLAQVVRDLEGQVSQLTTENIRLKLLEDENKQLRDQLNFLNVKKARYVMANIIYGGDSDLVNQSLVIDKGSKSGLIDGLAIVNSNGQVVGKILAVKPETSEICLVTSSNCQFAATVQDKNKTMGIAKGELGLTIMMDFIPQTEVIKKNDVIFTSGLERNVARGLVIGQVSEVIKESNALWQKAKIETFGNLNELSSVSVMLP